MLIVVVKKMGGRHSKPEKKAKAPPPPPTYPFPCACPCPFPYPPPPLPNSYWGRKPNSHPVSIPSSMPSLETASLPSAKWELAAAPAKIGISKSSETIQVEDMRIKVRREHIKTASRSIRHVHCDIEMKGSNGNKGGSVWFK